MSLHIDKNWSKVALVAHLHQPHEQPDGRVIRHILPPAEMAKWTKEELTNAHRELHEPKP